MNLSFLVPGIGFVLVGIIAATLGRRMSNAPPPAKKKATASFAGTAGMFFLGLGLVLVIIGL